MHCCACNPGVAGPRRPRAHTIACRHHEHSPWRRCAVDPNPGRALARYRPYQPRERALPRPPWAGSGADQPSGDRASWLLQRRWASFDGWIETAAFPASARRRAASQLALATWVPCAPVHRTVRRAAARPHAKARLAGAPRALRIVAARTSSLWPRTCGRTASRASEYSRVQAARPKNGGAKPRPNSPFHHRPRAGVMTCRISGLRNFQCGQLRSHDCCQWPSVSPHWRPLISHWWPCFFRSGHQISPPVAIVSPQPVARGMVAFVSPTCE